MTRWQEVLVLCKTRPELLVHQIASELGIHRAYVSRQMVLLRKKGLIDPRNARRGLTSTGEIYVKGLAKVWTAGGTVEELGTDVLNKAAWRRKAAR